MNRHRNKKAAQVKNWLWKPDKGEPMYPKDMTTRHLVNALKMLIANTDPHRLPPVGVSLYPSIMDWSPAYIKRAIAEFTKELRTRPDCSEEELFTILL